MPVPSSLCLRRKMRCTETKHPIAAIPLQLLRVMSRYYRSIEWDGIVSVLIVFKVLVLVQDTLKNICTCRWASASICLSSHSKTRIANRRWCCSCWKTVLAVNVKEVCCIDCSTSLIHVAGARYIAFSWPQIVLGRRFVSAPAG